VGPIFSGSTGNRPFCSVKVILFNISFVVLNTFICFMMFVCVRGFFFLHLFGFFFVLFCFIFFFFFFSLNY
jgi:hypothetical protein